MANAQRVRALQLVDTHQGVQLDTFNVRDIARVTLTFPEVVAINPVDGQPHCHKVVVTLDEPESSLEYASVERYLQTFREMPIFTENLAAVILETLDRAGACNCTVEVSTENRKHVVASK